MDIDLSNDIIWNDIITWYDKNTWNLKYFYQKEIYLDILLNKDYRNDHNRKMLITYDYKNKLIRNQMTFLQ